MKKIDGSPKTLKELLLNTKYSIHYYQREYQWQRKQIEEMIEDLTSEFLLYYQDGDDREKVKDYGAYFMGSVVLTGRDNAIIDGQQRLTSLTLLIIYLLNSAKNLGIDDSNLRGMVYSEAFGKKSFNIDVEERNQVLEALFNNNDYDITNIKNESIKNIYNAYQNIVDTFPEYIVENCLLNFGDWLQEKICFIQIVADTEQDAHKVFVSMNDRGLSLTPAEMLKGFLLSQIEDDKEREISNGIWKETIIKLKEIDVKEDETFFKNWLRAKYAVTIRETKKGAENKDFDIIGTEFHKWVSENKKNIRLFSSNDYVQFIKDIKKYAEIYIKIRNAEEIWHDKFRYVYYNSNIKFTLQMQVLLAPITIDDSEEIIDKKIDLCSKFLDLYIYSRAVESRATDYNTVKNAIFNITKKIRNLGLNELSKELCDLCNEYDINVIRSIENLTVTGFTKKYIRNMLARITSYIEEKSGMENNYVGYVDREQKHPYDIEHITPDHYEWYTDEYTSKEEFDSYRNNFADLLILHNHINQSLSDNKYIEKLNTYESANGNILSATLGRMVYEHNPNFKKFIKERDLNFKFYDKFEKNEINERKILYKKLCDEIWNVNSLKIN